MNERIKTILLILFIAGVIGAFNAIIGLSQSTGTNPWQTIGQALGLVPKPTPEPGRKFDFIAGELSKGQPATVQPNNSPSTTPIITAATPQPTPKPTPTPITQPMQTTRELPPLPPIGGKTLGTSTVAKKDIPPLPPIKKPPVKTLGAKTEIPSLELEFQGFFNSAANFFGF